MSTTADEATVLIYQVVRQSTRHGDFEFDDNNSYSQAGSDEEVLSGFFASAATAQQECDRCNTGVYAELCDQSEHGPFAEVDDENDDSEFGAWADRVALPWPQFCDWLKDHGIPRPGIDEDGGDLVGEEELDPEAVKQILAGDPPPVHEMRDWWENHINVYGEGVRERGIERIALLKEVVPGPKLYYVRSERLYQSQIDRLTKELELFTTVKTGAKSVVVTADFVTCALRLARAVGAHDPNDPNACYVLDHGKPGEKDG